MLLVPLLPGMHSLSLLNLSVSSLPSYTGHLLQLVCTPLKASGNVYTWRIFEIISSTLPRVPGALVVRAKILAQPSQSRKKFLVTYCLIEMRNPKIFIEAMFVIIPNWNQSSCVLLLKKKKRLGKFAYADPKKSPKCIFKQENQSQNDRYSIMPLILKHPPKKKSLYLLHVCIHFCGCTE